MGARHYIREKVGTARPVRAVEPAKNIRELPLYMRRHLRWLIWECPTNYSEVISGLLAVVWGLAIVVPTTTSTSTDIRHGMERFAPYAVWGAVILAVGILQTVASVTGLVKLRLGTAIIAGPFWLFIGIVILLSGVRVLGAFIYAIIAVMCAWAFIRTVWLELRD